jgi:hypothetical protein
MRDRGIEMLVGYMRVSRAVGSQVLDLQRDALTAAGVKPKHLMRIEPPASGTTAWGWKPVPRP